MLFLKISPLVIVEKGCRTCFRQHGSARRSANTYLVSEGSDSGSRVQDGIRGPELRCRPLLGFIGTCTSRTHHPRPRRCRRTQRAHDLDVGIRPTTGAWHSLSLTCKHPVSKLESPDGVEGPSKQANRPSCGARLPNPLPTPALARLKQQLCTKCPQEAPRLGPSIWK